MANQAYFNGEFYQCVSATSPGETPLTHAAKWARVQIPAKFRFVLARLTYARLLEMDGQKEKAQAERRDAYERERLGLNDLARSERNREGHRSRPNVQINT